MTLISLCMIVKNEESELPLVLSSAKDLVDETVIYDTGSEDNSITIARQFGAKVIEGYWDKDFSRARNEALEACKGEWILWLDADEAIHGNFEISRKIVAEEKKLDAFLIPIESVELHGIGTASAFHASRLFRREKCHWLGPLHEQVTLRSNDDFPGAMFLPHLRILHRGYTNLKWQSKDLINRNLAIAKKALDDPSVPKARALFDYGRTMTQGNDPFAAVPILTEAAEITDSPTILRASYRIIFEIYLSVSMLDKAEEIIEILRKEYKTSYTVDSLYVKLLLQKKSYEECIRVANRIPYTATDDDGVEIGSFNVAWIKANAQNALGRHGEAADTLLNVLKQHGKLDENLRVLVDYLHKAGRDAEEIADYTREESVGILAALAGTLNIEDSDKILAKFLLLYPDKKEPLAAIAKRLPELPIPRQMWWSNELRIRGLKNQCPLIATLNDGSLDPHVRLTAGAAAYLAFSDEQALQEGVAVYNGIGEDQKVALLQEIAGISKEYAVLIASEASSVHISAEPCECKGYEHYFYGTVSAGSNADSPKRHGLEGFLRHEVARPKNGFHEIKLDSALSGLSHLEAGRVIKIIASLLGEGGLLKFRVNNLFEAMKYMTGGDPIASRRVLYGHKRYSPQRTHAYIHDAWAKDEITEYLQASDMTVESCTEEDGLNIVCRKNIPLISESRTENFDTSLILIPDSKTSGNDFLQWLGQLNENGELDGVEIVVAACESAKDLIQAIGGLSGDIVKIFFGRETDFSSSLDWGIQKSRGENIVYLQSGLLPSGGWLNGLKSALSDKTAGVLSIALTDPSGIVVSAGYKIFSGQEGSLKKETVKSYLDAKKALVTETPVDMAGHWCFAVRKEVYKDVAPLSPFFQPDDAVTDISLRLKELGYQNKVIKDHSITIKNIDDGDLSPSAAHCYSKDISKDLLAEEWGAWVPKNEQSGTHKISASHLLPTTTILERTQNLLTISPNVSQGGVNLVGDFSRDITLALFSLLKESGVKVAGVDFTYNGIKTLQDGPMLPYYVNLLCVPGYKLVDLVGTFGIDMAAERYNVLYWDWPLAQPNDEARSEMAMVSEVWTPSLFSYKSIKDFSVRDVKIVRPFSKRIIRPVNASQTPDKTGFIHITRLREGWDTEEVTGNTVMTAEAFIEAFGEDAAVNLEIIFTGEENKKLFSKCLEITKGYGNISVIQSNDPDFIKAEIANSGCYVSFHKSCAYDLDMVTAVANGVLVLSTNYGGITDIVNHETAEMTAHKESLLDEALFPLPIGAAVAEVEKSTAVAALRRVMSDSDSIHRKSWLARKNLNNLYNSKESVQAVQTLLKKVAKIQPVAAGQSPHRKGV